MPEIKGSAVLVTGGVGNIGSHLVDALVEEGAGRIIIYDNFSEGERENIEWALSHGVRIEIVRGDIRDREDFLLATRGVDFVCHLASVLLLESMAKPQKAIDVNVQGTFNVLEACVKNSIKKLIFASSASVFGDPVYLPVDENHPFNNITFYGATKLAGEQFCTSFHHTHNLDFIGLRAYNVYGPRQGIKGAYAQILPRWLDRIDDKKPLVIFGDGTQTMDLIYVKDVAQAYVCSLKSDTSNEFFNIGTGVETSVLELAELVMRVKDFGMAPVYEVHDQNLVKRRRCATGKAEALIGFRAATPLESGIREYVQWRESRRKRDWEVAA